MYNLLFIPLFIDLKVTSSKLPKLSAAAAPTAIVAAMDEGTDELYENFLTADLFDCTLNSKTSFMSFTEVSISQDKSTMIAVLGYWLSV